MDKHATHRIVGHGVCMLLQVLIFLNMHRKLEKNLATHPELQDFAVMLPRFMTLWNVGFQVMYSYLALACDFTTGFKIESVVPTWLRKFRFTFAVGVLYPWSSAILAFWVFFFYDRELILPQHLDIVVSPACNFVWHGFIMVYALWELKFLPQLQKTLASFTLLITTTCLYTGVLFYTRYVDLGRWPYAILALNEGTKYESIVIWVVALGGIYNYFVQFRLKNYLEGRQNKLCT
ncbi:androgen-dependent TFPI-regulating protein-like [Ostrinia nubilalis]|uniref:androgen-dependent TFPI-regulating protein-like n=1 Tax=Ostrinia nubilalis TaxID=29057 RepID=UPI00308243A0